MNLELVVACTKRKHGQIHQELLFDSLDTLPANELAAEWIARTKLAVDKRPASELYAGPGWAANISAFNTAKLLGPCHLHILSAGFGLVEAAEPLPPYSATFGNGVDAVADRVADPSTRVDRHRLWYKSVNCVRGLGDSPLCDTANSGIWVLALGSDYLDAIADDISKLADTIGSDRLFIITVGNLRPSLARSVGQYRISIDLRIETIVGGPRRSINARALEWLLNHVVPHSGWNRDRIEAKVDTLLGILPNRRSATAEANIRVSDQDICEWIRKALAKNNSTSRTSALAELRTTGTACEQSRFARLFATVQSSLR